MQRKFRIRFRVSRYDNRKSKIENRKLVGLVAIAFTFVLGGVLAQAQQAGKIFRIGYLDSSTASR